MKRLFLLFTALWLSCSAASAAITISVIFTPGAVAALPSGTTMQNRADQVADQMNSTMIASGATGVSFTAVATAAGPTAPPDSASMAAQYTWAKNDVAPLQAKWQQNASFTVVVSNPSGSPDGVMSPSVPTGSKDAVAAIPYNKLDTQMEYAISRAMGAGSGVHVRRRDYGYAYPYNPPIGAPVCFHTKENTGSSPSEVVPYLSYWTLLGIDATTTTVRTDTQLNSCAAWRDYQRNIGPSSSFQSYRINNPDSTFSQGSCTLLDSSGNPTGTYTAGFTYVNSTGGSTISCSDTALNLYSSASASAMSSNYTTVFGWQFQNGDLLNRARAGIWAAIRSILGL